MPEGPEVRVIADALNQTLTGRYIVNLSYNTGSRYAKKGLLGHQQFIDALPLRINHIITKGKRIIFCLDQDIYLVSFLGMEGHWMFVPEKHSNLWLDMGSILPTTPRLRLIEYTLFYDDSRHFGFLDIIFGQNALQTNLAHIGPDLLQETVSMESWRGVITRPRLKNKIIGDFLHEQKYFSGIGNYLRAEILYQTKIHPERSLGQLTPDEIAVLLITAQQILRASYAHNGHTEYTFFDPLGRKGTFPVVVYNCSTCPLGHPITVTHKQKLNRKTGNMEKTGQGMHWCPTCQH